MDINHTDFELKKDEATDVEYRKCSTCKAVAFENDDPYFNMVCLPRLKDREQLRQGLRLGS